MRYLLLLGFLFSTLLGNKSQAQPHIYAYIDKYKELSVELMNESGIPASIILGIAIHETGAGKSLLSRTINNHFGIKGKHKIRIPGTNKMTAYKKFESDTASFRYFCMMIGKRKFYTSLKGNQNYKPWVPAIARTGYAANAERWTKSINLTIRKFKLYELDKLNGSPPVIPKEEDQKNDPFNPYHLPLIKDSLSYRKIIEKDSNNRLVDVSRYVHGIVLDMRYATTNNFTGKKIYTEPRAFLVLPAAKALAKIQDELRPQGLGLKVYDAYRPYAATLLFYDIVKDTVYVAAPWKGSRHNRGCAVDVTLVRVADGTELEMPSLFDDFSKKSSPANDDITPEVRKNRDLLIHLMEKNGFTVFPDEWWHFDYDGWIRYDLKDLPFEQLN